MAAGQVDSGNAPLGPHRPGRGGRLRWACSLPFHPHPSSHPPPPQATAGRTLTSRNRTGTPPRTRPAPNSAPHQLTSPPGAPLLIGGEAPPLNPTTTHKRPQEGTANQRPLWITRQPISAPPPCRSEALCDRRLFTRAPPPPSLPTFHGTDPAPPRDRLSGSPNGSRARPRPAPRPCGGTGGASPSRHPRDYHGPSPGRQMGPGRPPDPPPTPALRENPLATTLRWGHAGPETRPRCFPGSRPAPRRGRDQAGAAERLHNSHLRSLLAPVKPLSPRLRDGVAGWLPPHRTASTGTPRKRTRPKPPLPTGSPENNYYMFGLFSPSKDFFFEKPAGSEGRILQFGTNGEAGAQRNKKSPHTAFGAVSGVRSNWFTPFPFIR